MSEALVECVPNFSEGHDREVVEAITAAMGRFPGAAVLGYEMDADHHRSVVTVAGEPRAVVDAVVAGVGVAVERIDLTRHHGVHPRAGAADVVPFVPVSGIGLAGCAELAVAAGEMIWRRFGVPVYLYEAAARRPDRRSLPSIRRGGFEVLRSEALADPARAPDIGGPALHPTAGAAIVGARKFLLAFNINLATSDLRIARQVAAAIRESNGGLPCVRALGVPLASRNLAQVTMNLTDFEVTGLEAVYDAVEAAARARGVEILESEMIGLFPAQSLPDDPIERLRLRNFSADRVLEERLHQLLHAGQEAGPAGKASLE